MLRPGTMIGSYEIEAQTGSGGMSNVYRARHRVLHSRHALKVLRSEHAKDPVLRERFVKEGQVLAQLVHPALVRVTDVLNQDGVAALVMDHLEGVDLAKTLKERGPLSHTEAAGLLLQALSGIEHAHQAHVFHRDLKPGNLFLVPRSDDHPADVKVLDFGIAKVGDSFVTRGDDAMGTAAYMSPEQIEHSGEVDARSDVFSAGVVLFEMVAGYRPFSGDSQFTMMQRISEGNRRRIPDEAGPLGPVLRKALQADPADRYPSAAAFAAALWPFAPESVRQRVEGWAGAGPASEVAANAPRDALAPPAPMARPPRSDAVPQRDPVRWLGTLQLVSGLFNVGVMSVVQCFGLGALGGLPACFGGLLFGVGLVEIASGLQALVFRNPRWLWPTALLEIVSLAGLGLLSTMVGVVVLLVRRRNPDALP